MQRANPPGLFALQVLNANLVAARWGIDRSRRPFPERSGVLDDGRDYVLRPLEEADLPSLASFLEEIPDGESRFIPHRTGRGTLRSLLRCKGLYPVGLSIGHERSTLVGYGLLRPTLIGKALFAVVVGRSARGVGVGTVITGSLVDHAVALGQRPFSLVYGANSASVACLTKVGMELRRIDNGLYTVTLPENRRPGRGVTAGREKDAQ